MILVFSMESDVRANRLQVQSYMALLQASHLYIEDDAKASSQSFKRIDLPRVLSHELS